MVESDTMKAVNHNEIHESKVSHNPEITKRVILPNGSVDNITQMSQATLQPGQATAAHIHNDMAEIYTLYAGEAEFTVDGLTLTLEAPATSVIYPGEKHSVANKSGEPVTLHYIGVLSAGKDNA